MKPPNRSTLAGLLALIVLTFVSYGPALNAGFIWDDDDYVEENELLDAPDALDRIWFEKGATPQYYPAVFTMFWLENKLWGRGPEDTTGYHIVNVILHILSALLLWRILRALSVPGAWFVAAVFALHPVHVESVAWITERKNVLSGMFYLSAFLSYLRFAGLGRKTCEPAPIEPEPSKKKKNKAPAKQVTVPSEAVRVRVAFYGLALVLFAGALLSKSVTASLPAAMLLVLYWKRGRITMNDVLLLVPFFAIGINAGLATAEVEKTNVFKLDVDLGVHGAEHFLVAGRAIWFYVSKLLFPHDLTFMYPRWALDSSSFAQWLFPIFAALTLAAAWFLRKRIGRGPVVALLFFGGTLIPALGFVDVYPMYYSYVADHFQYLASLGVIVLVVGGGAGLLLRVTSERAALIAGSVLVLFLSALTWNQCHDYQDLRTLWRVTLERNPGALMAAINLSNKIVREDTDYAEANAILDEALKHVDDGLHPTIHARAHYNYGNNLWNLKNLEKAVEKYNSALEIDPGYLKVYESLGDAHRLLGNKREALKNFELHLEGLRKINLDNPKVRAKVAELKKSPS